MVVVELQEEFAVFKTNEIERLLLVDEEGQL